MRVITIIIGSITLPQGFKFLGKAMKIIYARGTSDIVARANGTAFIDSRRTTIYSLA